MPKRAKLLIAGTALVAVLGLAAATNAWFVALSKTPSGVVHSALVRCLPEVGPDRDTTSLLTYGSLVSGNSVDTDNVSLILPGDSLLSVQSWSGGSRTVRTSLARDFQGQPTWPVDETPGTVIHRTERTGADGAAATRVQRDLMNADPDKVYETSLWYEGETAIGAPITDPGLNLTDYTAVTTAGTTVDKVGDPAAKTITTVTITTVYTPRAADGQSYTYVHKTIEEVTHEKAVYSPGEAAYEAITAPVLVLETEETVFSADPAQKVTRSYMVITETPASVSAKADATPLALALGNLSTVDTNIRVGLNATVTRTTADGVKTVTPLVLKSGTEAVPADPADQDAYFLGLERESDHAFIELFRFEPAEEDGYQWVRSTDDTQSKTWSLFDLSLRAPAQGADPLDIPPPVQPTPAPDPSASPTAAESPAPGPVETVPEFYSVLDVLRVVSKSAFHVEKTSFEQSFNDLYCSQAPTIRLSVHFYVRQSEYMEWSEFYSDSLSFTVPAA